MKRKLAISLAAFMSLSNFSAFGMEEELLQRDSRHRSRNSINNNSGKILNSKIVNQLQKYGIKEDGEYQILFEYLKRFDMETTWHANCFKLYLKHCNNLLIYKLDDEDGFREIMENLREKIAWRFCVDGRLQESGDSRILNNNREENGITIEGEPGWIEKMLDGLKKINEYRKYPKDNYEQRRNYEVLRVTTFEPSTDMKNQHCIDFHYGTLYQTLHDYVTPLEFRGYNNNSLFMISCVNFKGLLEFFIRSRKEGTLTKGWHQQVEYTLRNWYKKSNSLYNNARSRFIPGGLIADAVKKIEKINKIDETDCFTLEYNPTEYKNALDFLKKNFFGLYKSFSSKQYKLNEKVYSKDEAIIATIVELCQTLDQGHFFSDGNVRTAYLFLNFLLIYFGFFPTILDNPNDLDFHDIEDLVNKVIKGQQKAVSLFLEEGSGYNVYFELID